MHEARESSKASSQILWFLYLLEQYTSIKGSSETTFSHIVF